MPIQLWQSRFNLSNFVPPHNLEVALLLRSFLFFLTQWNHNPHVSGIIPGLRETLTFPTKWEADSTSGVEHVNSLCVHFFALALMLRCLRAMRLARAAPVPLFPIFIRLCLSPVDHSVMASPADGATDESAKAANTAPNVRLRDIRPPTGRIAEVTTLYKSGNGRILIYIIVVALAEAMC
jgi:hypothetical protein